MYIYRMHNEDSSKDHHSSLNLADILSIDTEVDVARDFNEVTLHH